MVGDTGSSSSSSLPKLCDERLLARRFRRSCRALKRLRLLPRRLSESSPVASSSGATTAVLLLLFRNRLVYLKEGNVSYKREKEERQAASVVATQAETLPGAAVFILLGFHVGSGSGPKGGRSTSVLGTFVAIVLAAIIRWA